VIGLLESRGDVVGGAVAHEPRLLDEFVELRGQAGETLLHPAEDGVDDFTDALVRLLVARFEPLQDRGDLLLGGLDGLGIGLLQVRVPLAVVPDEVVLGAGAGGLSR